MASAVRAKSGPNTQFIGSFGRLLELIPFLWAEFPIDLLVANGLLSTQIKQGGDYMQAYCMKCRAKKEIKDPKSIIMKNKRPATQGVCPTCGTKVFRIGKS